MQVEGQFKEAYLLSFLAILVERAGGRLSIENLSEFKSTQINIGADLDVDGDRVTLTTEKKKKEINQ